MSSCRLYVLLARNANRALIFRRGPSKQVALIGWHTRADEFEIGQWFKGRIYERRCDLSPSGHELIYFAANYKKPYLSWTAISNPPFLKALVLWPKGDGWAGGGMFENESTVLLNHKKAWTSVAEGFHLPNHYTLKYLDGVGEDNPLWNERLHRDGWVLMNADECHKDRSRQYRLSNQYKKPVVYGKPNPNRKHAKLELQMVIAGHKEKNGPWYAASHRLLDLKTNDDVWIDDSEWADWDKNGDLLFAKKGKLFRWKIDSNKALDPSEATELADFSSLQPL